MSLLARRSRGARARTSLRRQLRPYFTSSARRSAVASAFRRTRSRQARHGPEPLHRRRSTPGTPSGGVDRLQISHRRPGPRPCVRRGRAADDRGAASRRTSRARSAGAASSSAPGQPHHHDQRHAVADEPRRASRRAPRRVCPASTRNADATPRCVTGMPASSGRRHRRRHAGHDLERDARHAPAPAPLRRRGRTRTGRRPSAARRACPARAARIIRRWIVSCLTLARPARLPTQKHCASVSAPQRLGIHERVVQHQVGFLRRASARERSTARDRPDRRRPATRGLGLSHCQLATLNSRRSFLLVQPVQRLEQQRPPLFHRHAVALPLRAAPRPPPTSTRRGRPAATRRAPRAAGRPAPARGRRSKSRSSRPSRRTTPPRYAVACAGSSTAFTKTPPRLGGRQHLPVDLGRRRRHHPPGAVQIRGLERPAMERHAGPLELRRESSGATTVTCAPAASKPFELPRRDRSRRRRARTRRPVSLRKAGYMHRRTSR